MQASLHLVYYIAIAAAACSLKEIFLQLRSTARAFLFRPRPGPGRLKQKYICIHTSQCKIYHDQLVI